MSSDSTWVAPPDDWLSFTNCSIASYWMATFTDQHYYDTQYHDAPLIATYDYVMSVMPLNWTTPSFGDALSWYDSLDGNSTVWNDFYYFPIIYCPAELCQQLRWDGDPDLAGIGVMAVYYLAAAFSTLYCVVLGIDRLKPFSRDSRLKHVWDKTCHAFEESLNGFIDAGLLFAIAMLVAASYRHASSRIHPDKTHSLYGLVNSSYLSIFAIFPPLLLQMVAKDLRRLRTRLVMWFFVIAFSITVSGLYLNLRTSQHQLEKLLIRDAATTDVFWEYDCEPQKLRDALDGTLTLAQVLLGLNMSWWLYWATPTAWRTRLNNAVANHQQLNNAWTLASRLIKPINGAICAAVMWTLLGLFSGYRFNLEHIMGSSNQDGQWSFGQMLALATWVPVAIDLISIYIYGAREALEGKVSERYNVVEARSPEIYNAPIQMSNEQQYDKTGAVVSYNPYGPPFTP